MSQVENTRPRTGQIIRPQSFNGQPGQPGQVAPRDYQGPDPGYFPPGVGWQGGSECGSGCGNEQCGCGSMYGGPGHGFCWYCMKTMLVKEIACLLKTDPELQAILNAPAMGITDGSSALPGQVGEVLNGQATLNIPAVGAGVNYQTNASPLILTPGDWMCFNYAWWSDLYEGVYFYLNPYPAGSSTDMAGGLFSPTGITDATIADGAPAHILVSQPTRLAYSVSMNGATGGSPAGQFDLQVQAVRIR
jgi:hypothetical protein